MFNFEKLWTPSVIEVLWAIVSVLIVIGGCVGIYTALSGPEMPPAMADYGTSMAPGGMMVPNAGAMAGGLLTMVLGHSGWVGALIILVVTLLGLIFWRVWCEIIMILFKIDRHIQQLAVKK